MNKNNQGGKFPWLLGEQYYANIQYSENTLQSLDLFLKVKLARN